MFGAKLKTFSGNINHINPALIGQYRMLLRLERHPRTQLILLTDEAQRHGHRGCSICTHIFAGLIHGMRLVSDGKGR